MKRYSLAAQPADVRTSEIAESTYELYGVAKVQVVIYSAIDDERQLQDEPVTVPTRESNVCIRKGVLILYFTLLSHLLYILTIQMIL